MNNKIVLASSIILSVAIILLAAAYFFGNVFPAMAGVPIGNSYQATSTSPLFSPINSSMPIKNGVGELGEVVISGAGGGFILYDATTTNASLRAKATSSLRVLAAFGNSPTVGTYTYNTAFYDGLIISYNTGGTAIGTTTITHR